MLVQRENSVGQPKKSEARSFRSPAGVLNGSCWLIVGAETSSPVRRRYERLIDRNRSRSVAPRPCEVTRNRPAFDQFHGEEPLRPVGMNIEQGNEIWVADVLERPDLFPHPVQRRRVELLHLLERDQPAGFTFAGLVDDAHAPFAQLLDNLVELIDGRTRLRPTG